MGAIGWWVARNPLWDEPGNTLLKVQWLAGGVAASVLFYLAAMGAFKSEEFRFLRQTAKTRRRKGSGT
jgi:hypothetical protein